MIKDKLNYFYRHSFIRNTAVLGSGTFSANLIQAIVGVFLARLLQPELFGVYTLAFSLGALIITFLSIGSQETVSALLGEAYAREDKPEINNTLAFLIKIFIITGVIAVFAIILSPIIGELFYDSREIGIFAGIFVASLFLSNSVFTVVKIILQVIGKIKDMTVMILADQAVRSGLSIGLVILGFGVVGAVSGHILGAIIILIVSLMVWEKVKVKNPIFPSLSGLLANIKETKLKKYLGFSIWVALDKNIANLYLILPIILTGIYVSASELTFFKLSFAYINFIVALLGPVSALLNVEFPKMKVEDQPSLARNFIKVSLYSTGLSALLTAGAVLISPIAFKILYGEAFLPSIQYTFGLFVYGALMGIGVGLGSMWRAIDKVKVSIIINVITLGIGIPFGLFLIKNYGLWGSVIMVTAWFTVSHFASFAYLANYLKKTTNAGGQ